MILVLIFLCIIIILFLFFLVLLLSSIKLEIKDFELSNITEITTKDYMIKMSINLFGKIKIFSIKLNSNKLKKIYSKSKLEKINLKEIKEIFTVEYIKNLKLELMYLNVKVKIGLEDVILTSSLVFIISTAISILLPHIIKIYNSENYKYEILPLYVNTNSYYIKLHCIIQLKIVHIINIIYIYLKKGRSDKYERASNRRSYEHSYE